MRGDFSQLFDSDDSVVGVLHQQGCVIRDSDLNQQTVRLWQMIVAMAKDIDALGSITPLLVMGEDKLRIAPPADGVYNEAIYIDGIRVALPATMLEVPLKTLPLIKDDNLGDLTPGTPFDVYVEILNTALDKAPDSRYLDSALRNTRVSGLRLAIVPRLRICSPGQVPESEYGAKLPTLQLSTKTDRLDSDNRLHRFELVSVNDQTKLKWSDDNGSNVRVAVLPEAVPTNGVLPRIARVRSVQLLEEDRSLTPTSWVEFLRPSRPSVFGNSQPKATQIEAVTEDGEIHFSEEVEIELDPFDAPGTQKPLAQFTVWRDVIDVAEQIDLANDFTLRFVDGDLAELTNHAHLGLSWTVETRHGHPQNAAVAHRSRHYKRLGNVSMTEGDTAALPTTARRQLVQTPTTPHTSSSEPLAVASFQPDPAPSLIQDVPLKLLDLQIASTPLRQWVASADLSEVAFLSAEELTENLLQAIDVPVEQQSFFDADVKSFVNQIESITQQLSVSSNQPAHV